MNALRLSAAAIAVAAVLAVAIGACGPGQTISECALPSVDEKAADGGPDPCHCAPPDALNITTCPCLSGTPQDVDAYNGCMVLFRGEEDAGAEGGPIAGECTGQCWPPPPDYWGSPLLLWIGAENVAPPCPIEAPFVFYNGYASGAFALACTSGASGACAVPGYVCAPGYSSGFAQCFVREGDVDCPVLGPYTQEHLFYEEADGQPVQASTFCCLPAPLAAP